MCDALLWWLEWMSCVNAKCNMKRVTFFIVKSCSFEMKIGEHWRHLGSWIILKLRSDFFCFYSKIWNRSNSIQNGKYTVQWKKATDFNVTNKCTRAVLYVLRTSKNCIRRSGSHMDTWVLIFEVMCSVRVLSCFLIYKMGHLNLMILKFPFFFFIMKPTYCYETNLPFLASSSLQFPVAHYKGIEEVLGELTLWDFWCFWRQCLQWLLDILCHVWIIFGQSVWKCRWSFWSRELWLLCD